MRPNDISMMRLLQSTRRLPETMPPARSPGSDAGTLARELCVKFVDDLKKYARCLEVDRKIIDGEPVAAGDCDRALEAQPPDQVRYATLQWLAHVDPKAALERWEKVKDAAREDLFNGWQASRSVCNEIWERACFFAVREELQALWPPRNGAEAMIIDEMTQYETLRRKLLTDLLERKWTYGQKSKDYLVPASLLQAVERLQRLFQYALRTLLGLRRNSLPVVVTGSSPPKLTGRADSDPDAPHAADTCAGQSNHESTKERQHEIDFKN